MFYCYFKTKHTTDSITNILWRGVGTSKHNWLVSYLLCWRRHVSATVQRGVLFSVYSLVTVHVLNFQRDLGVFCFSHIELIVFLILRVQHWKDIFNSVVHNNPFPILHGKPYPSHQHSQQNIKQNKNVPCSHTQAKKLHSSRNYSNTRK